ncbi:MAG: hypothetical protein AAB834_03410, partial [Patescibacteria group bacterium]
ASGSEIISNFTRSLVISDVNRDSVTGNIVATGGIPDPSTKQVDISVTWGTPLASSVTTTMYFTRYLDNLAYTETTRTQFEAEGSIIAGTTVTDTAGGEVTLGGGGHGDWCAPDLTLAQVDLPKNGVANALTAIPATANPSRDGYAFAGTGDNASGVSFARVDITDTDPPQATSPPSNHFDPGGNMKTNDVFGEADYGYLATDTNSKEIVIISLTAPYSESGYFDAPGPGGPSPKGNGQANSVFVNGSTGYMTTGTMFYTFDLSSKTGNRGAPTGQVQLSGTGEKVTIVGSYAYVAISGNTGRELEIINISNLSIVAWADVSGVNGRDVYVTENGSRAYLVTANSPSPELFIIDTSSQTG